MEPPVDPWEGKCASWRESGRVAIWGALAVAVVAGAMLPLQAGINAELARFIDGPSRAAFVSFLVGTLALLVLSLVATRGLPSPGRLDGAPWWIWVGGLLGAFYVFGSIVAAPRLGAVVLIGAVLAGQSVASLLIDHYGWVGFEEHAITPGRVVGVALLAVGVALVRAF
jgi:bacterial/archaeal transporter family-2 protein